LKENNYLLHIIYSTIEIILFDQPFYREATNKNNFVVCIQIIEQKKLFLSQKQELSSSLNLFIVKRPKEVVFTLNNLERNNYYFHKRKISEKLSSLLSLLIAK